MKTVNLRTVLILTFQLVIIIVLVIFGTMYTKKMAVHSENTIKDNLRSVRYCIAMRKSLYNMRGKTEELQPRVDFENNLQGELNNITEPGERELANEIKDNYFLWLKFPDDSTFNKVLENIDAVNELNIAGIDKKNIEIQQVSSRANSNIILLGFLGVFAAFIFTFTFIGQLIKPKN